MVDAEIEGFLDRGQGNGVAIVQVAVAAEADGRHHQFRVSKFVVVQRTILPKWCQRTFIAQPAAVNLF